MSLATLMAQLSPRCGLEAGLGVLARRPSLYPGGPGCFPGASRWGAGGLSAGGVWGLLPCEPSAPQASFWQWLTARLPLALAPHLHHPAAQGCCFDV